MHSFDLKHRMPVPADLRGQLERAGEVALFAAPGPNGHIWLWPESTFERLASLLTESLVPEEDQLSFEEFLFSQSRRLQIDGSGRIRLPESLLSRTKIVRNVVVIGVRDHLELREPEDWEAIRKQHVAEKGEIIWKARRLLGTSNSSSLSKEEASRQE